jgi:hypothetical protein
MTIAGQRFVKHVPAVTDELLEAVISPRFAPSYKRGFVREFKDSFVKVVKCSAVEC